MISDLPQMGFKFTFHSFKKLGKSWEFNGNISIGTLFDVKQYLFYKIFM